MRMLRTQDQTNKKLMNKHKNMIFKVAHPSQNSTSTKPCISSRYCRMSLTTLCRNVILEFICWRRKSRYRYLRTFNRTPYNRTTKTYAKRVLDSHLAITSQIPQTNLLLHCIFSVISSSNQKWQLRPDSIQYLDMLSSNLKSRNQERGNASKELGQF